MSSSEEKAIPVARNLQPSEPLEADSERMYSMLELLCELRKLNS